MQTMANRARPLNEARQREPAHVMTSLTPTAGQARRDADAPLEPSIDILKRLERLHPKEIDLSLDRVLRLLDTLGKPQNKLDTVVHVAGTNGKGSVIAYMKAVLEAAGKSVNVFTSPHLVNFHERFVLHGREISENLLCDVLLRVETANKGEPITFFEITTAAAFLAFAENPADVVLLETGLGGRLDATNVIDRPALTVITPISHDHERFLGADLAGISLEKAGILKKGVPCILARQPAEVLEVVERRAGELDVPVIAQGQSWDAFEQHGRLVFQTDTSLLDLPLPNLAGRHQIDNAGTALAAVRALADESINTAALANGLKSAVWPARLQNLTGSALQPYLPEGSEIWLDGGHNEAAAKVLAHAMAEMEERTPLPLHLICGMMTGKDANSFFKQFSTLSEWVGAIPVPGTENGFDPDELATMARDADLPADALPELMMALQASRTRTEGPVRVLICGSLYLAGSVLAMLKKENPGH